MARKNKLRLSALGDKPPSRGGTSRPGHAPPGVRGRGAKPPGSSPYDNTDDDRLETAGFLFGSFLVVVLIIGLAVVFAGRKIESDLESNVHAFLLANDIRSVEVEASGLDLELTGIVDRESLLTAIPDAVRSNYPVRDLSVDLRVVLPPEANEIEVAPDSLVFDWSGDAVTVTGTMSKQSTVDAIVNSLASIYPNVAADGLVVREGVPDESDWLTAVLLLMSEVGTDVTEGLITVNPNGEVIQFAAEFDTRQERADVRSAAEDILAATTFEFSSGLTLVTVAPTTTAPPEVIEEVQKQFDDTITGKSVEFESGSAVLTNAGRELLDELLVTMLEFPEVPIEVAGHTDSVGSEETNLALSRRRAEAVVEYLVDNGADPARFVVIGYGEAQPIADNDTPEGRAMNRRIVFTALAE